MAEGSDVFLAALKVEVCSGNSILLTAVEADLGFPIGSTGLPNTATPWESKIGSSQGSA